MRVKTSSGDDEVEEMLSSDGEKISGSSSVVVYGSMNNPNMLIGTGLGQAYYCAPQTRN